MAPRATYRLQLHKGFTFDDAAALVPYLAKLGVSHLYASPFFKAHPGSTHGYDVVDYGVLNPELGGQPAFDRLAEAMKAHGLKLLLDFVPNHMGVGGADNPYWLDLLEWGEEADHAGWFDVDWMPDHAYILHKVLVPFLGGQYGAVLGNGDLTLRFDAEDGSFAVWAHDTHKLPINPVSYETVLGQASRALADLGDAFADVLRWRPQIMRRTRELKDQLARAARDPAARAAIDERVAHFTGRKGDLDSWAPLAALIAQQKWKAAHHIVASDDINYRRFFNIATLAGIRMELPAVFDHAHGLVFSMMRDGVLDGLRIDHIDGLFDPKQYLERLRSEAPLADPFYLVVEKILGPDESLHDDWPIEGTTGYDFTNLLTSFFVQQSNEAAFSRIYETATAEISSFESIIYSAKLQIMDNEMLSELHRVARSARGVARENPRTADFTLTSIQRAMRLLVASFPVYRTYVDGVDALPASDRRELDKAFAAARKIDRAIDPTLFDFLYRLLSGDLAADREAGYRRSDILRCAMKFQQYCGPVMAKGVEDTAFYRYYRFIALNEVGGSPDRFGLTVEHFHKANRARAERWPDSMLATSTHDTKRGEDTRARLAALSTMPQAWEEQVELWGVLNASEDSAAGPDRNDRYLLLQLLVGTWPASFLGAADLNPAELDDYVGRLKDVMTKSMREAKRRSTWTTPDEPYEAGAMALIDAALTGPTAPAFLKTFRPFVEEVAARGAQNSFAATVLKFTVPGMPDVYQGTDGWDLTMVDPDNRRPVDYAVRKAILDGLEGSSGTADALLPLWREWRDGAFKLAITRNLLALRQRDPALFARGSYEPIGVTGAGADAVCAFLRRGETVSLLVVAQRFPGSSLDGLALQLPDEMAGQGEGVLAGGSLALGTRVEVAEALGGLPAAAWLIPNAAH